LLLQFAEKWEWTGGAEKVCSKTSVGVLCVEAKRPKAQDAKRRVEEQNVGYGKDVAENEGTKEKNERRGSRKCKIG